MLQDKYHILPILYVHIAQKNGYNNINKQLFFVTYYKHFRQHLTKYGFLLYNKGETWNNTLNLYNLISPYNKGYKPFNLKIRKC